MKIKIMIITVGVILCFTTYINSQKESNASDIMSTNIEALAGGESGNYDCIKPFTAKCSEEGGIRIPGYKK